MKGWCWQPAEEFSAGVSLWLRVAVLSKVLRPTAPVLEGSGTSLRGEGGKCREEFLLLPGRRL